MFQCSSIDTIYDSLDCHIAILQVHHYIHIFHHSLAATFLPIPFPFLFFFTFFCTKYSSQEWWLSQEVNYRCPFFKIRVLQLLFQPWMFCAKVNVVVKKIALKIATMFTLHNCVNAHAMVACNSHVVIVYVNPPINISHYYIWWFNFQFVITCRHFKVSKWLSEFKSLKFVTNILKWRIQSQMRSIRLRKEKRFLSIVFYHIISFQGSYFRYTQNRYGHIPKHTCMHALIHTRTHACACTHDHGILRPTSVVKVSFFRDWRKVVISLLTCSLCSLNLLIHVDICWYLLCALCLCEFVCHLVPILSQW